MRRVLIVIVLVIAAAVLGLMRSGGGIRQGLARAAAIANEDQQVESRDEIRKSFQLQPGARVEVQGINGAVTIETSDTTTADVYVLRTARSKESLDRREVITEQTDSGLMVRGKQSRNLGFWERLWGRNPNEQVTIKAPRQISLALKGINGRVVSGEVEGSIEAKGINGRVELAQAGDSVEIGGVNGSVLIGFGQLGERGARVSGVNGNIELRFATGLNADLTAKGVNGNVRSEIPEVTVDKEDHAPRFSARIGNGGPPITLSGINGNTRLTRVDAATSSASSDKKPGAAKQKSEKTTTESRSEQ